MNRLKDTLRILMFVAASCLVVNDCFRFAFALTDSQVITTYLDNSSEDEEQKNNGGNNSFSTIEEETKHKEFPYPEYLNDAYESRLNVSIVHRIDDDQVKHLAYLPVESPPPDRI